MIARRVLLGKPAVMAVCFSAFVSSVVTSSYSSYVLTEDPVAGAAPENKIAAHSLAPVTPVLPAPVETAVSDIAPPSETDDAEAVLRANVEAAHPKFETWSLADAAPRDAFLKDGAPSQPEATIHLASLAPPEGMRDGYRDALFPRIPEAASIAILPPDLGRLDHRDRIGKIDTPEERTGSAAGVTVEGIDAVGGETIAFLLDEFDIDRDDKFGTLVSLRADKIPETLSAEDRVDLAFKPNPETGANDLLGIRLRFKEGAAGTEREVELVWADNAKDLWAALDGVKPTEEVAFRPVTTSEALDGHFLGLNEPERVFLQGTIRTSLFAAADDAGMTPGEATTLTDIFRYFIDFERDLRVGDRFEVMFDKKENGDYGDIAYAMIENRGRRIALFRAQNSEGAFEYFDEDGKTNRRALMRTPLAYARISSKYGMRKHPIDGYRKMHRGIDFRAARGTPIVAAGNGVVEYVGRRGGYGKYIRLRHNATYKTAYAHLSKYAPDLAAGMRVKQGDVIGFVGSTGRSTGPHLHFEVLENGKQVNPMAVGDFGPIRSLAGADLARFKAGIARINLVLSEMRSKAVVAQAQ